MDYYTGKGIISRINDRGGGFIKTGEREEDLLFQRDALQGVNFTYLREGQEVEFVMGVQMDGLRQAVEVRPIVKPKVRLAAKPAEDAGGDSQDDGGNGGDDGGNGGDDSGNGGS